MSSPTAIVLVMWGVISLALLLIRTSVLWRPAGAPPTVHANERFAFMGRVLIPIGHLLLCALCLLGAMGELPYQQQRAAVSGIDHARNAELFFGAVAAFGFFCAFLAYGRPIVYHALTFRSKGMLTEKEEEGEEEDPVWYEFWHDDDDYRKHRKWPFEPRKQRLESAERFRQMHHPLVGGELMPERHRSAFVDEETGEDYPTQLDRFAQIENQMAKRIQGLRKRGN